MSDKIVALKTELGKLYAESVAEFNLMPSITDSSLERIISAPEVDETMVFGRDQDIHRA